MQRKTRVTIKDVALRAGTSAATVSYVLNDVKGRYITPEMRKNVEDAAKELGYVKSMAASRLKGKRMGVVSFLTPQFDNHFFMEIFFAIEKIANEKGYVLSVCNTFDDPQHERTVLERMNQLWTDAVLIIPTHQGAENTSYLRTHGIPFVSIERPLAEIQDYDFISSDNFLASYRMTQYLIKKGHTRIALAYWDSKIINLDERLAGYRQALEENGISYDENLVFRTKLTQRTEELSHAEGERITKEVLKDPSISAVFYSQYVLAEGGIRYLRQAGKKIPEDISVCVLGGPRWTQVSPIRFTHIAQPGAAMGEMAAEIIFSKLENRLDKSYKQEKLDCTLVEGDSVKDIREI